MKAREGFAPIGPYLVTRDEIPDPQKLQVRLWNNGDLRQDFNTDDMAHSIPRTIAWVSSIHTLEPGDILATGTNHRGLHAFMDGDRGRARDRRPRPSRGVGARPRSVACGPATPGSSTRRGGLEGRFAAQVSGKYAPDSG